MVIDFHSHILPRMDDGSRSAEESIAMLKMAREQGIAEVIMTPHFYPQRSNPEQFLEKREAALERLLSRIGGTGDLPLLRVGAEVLYYPHMSHSDELSKLSIEGTNFILVEMPLSPWTDSMYQELVQIQENLGLTPIVAHVDRYLGRFRDHGIPKRLSQLPVLVQANADFFLKRSTVTKALSMLDRGQIHLLGSDCHNLTDRKPNLGPAVDLIVQKKGQKAIQWLRRNERTVLYDA